LGLRTARLPILCDVDDIETAQVVAALAPHTHFAACLTRILPALTAWPGLATPPVAARR
jgi:hypothetical protein